MDTKTLRLVILWLGLIALATVVGGMALTYNGHEVPAALYALGTSAVTAMVALLSRPPNDSAGVAAEIAAQPAAPPVDYSELQTVLGAALEKLTQASASPGPTAGTPPPWPPPPEPPAPAG